ncbi:MAG: hypothetical protein OEV44_14575 [Spirochaetota bacterium]|nr:hypothetical protein [Spirochaetota bacterium]
MINYFVFSLLASIIGLSIILFFFLIIIRKWLKNNTKIRKAMFAFFELNDHLNLVRDCYIKITEQKNKIQSILKNAIGRDEAEILNAFSTSYKELDEIMHFYLKSQQDLEKKLFGESRS